MMGPEAHAKLPGVQNSAIEEPNANVSRVRYSPCPPVCKCVVA